MCHPWFPVELWETKRSI